MGNVMKALQSPMGQLYVQGSDMEGRLLQELSELPDVELWRVQWGLSQAVLQDFPPIPPRWLWSADACTTATVMRRCYREEEALMVLAAVLTLVGQDQLACHHIVQPPKPRTSPKPDPDFVKTHRRRLINRIQRTETVLDELQRRGILDTTNRDVVGIYAVHRDKNRALVDLVLRKGDEAQDVFYQALSQSEPFLLQELEDQDPVRDKNASETSVLSEMLEFLVSDELRCFQWLVSSHMSGERHISLRDEPENVDRTATQRCLVKQLGSKRAENITKMVLLKIVPTLSRCLPGEDVTSQNPSDVIGETNAPVEIAPEVHKDGDMFRLRCQQPSMLCCPLTGLLLEGFGDVVYEMVPWDVDFLSSRGLRPAGPLFRFTLLKGSFQRLHLPHCQLLSDCAQHFLSVAHVTGDCVDFLTPGQVTDSHVIVDISCFSCFGLVTAAASDGAINGLVLLFTQPANPSLFVLLLPRNVCLVQVRKEWKRRIGADYVEGIPDCELIPNQIYKLNGDPVTAIQPEFSKFVNFSDYNNFLPSFQVQLPLGVTKVTLKLKSHVTGLRLIGWLFGPTEHEVWTRDIHLRASVWDSASDTVDITLQLVHILDCLTSEDLIKFQHLLSLQSDPIPVSHLEAADRTRTVYLMVQQYRAEGAKEVTEEILRRLKYNQLADDVQRG